MLGMISAVIGVLVLFATQRAFPELNERFKSFSSIGYLLLAGAFAVSTFNGIFCYAEPGFKYHVRTITGQEKMASDTGYNTYLYGGVNAWKNAMSVQATRGMKDASWPKPRPIHSCLPICPPNHWSYWTGWMQM